MKKINIALFILFGMTALTTHADVETAKKLADRYGAFAKVINPSSSGLSAEDGRAFFNRELTVHGKQVACASCHTSNPGDTGKHIVTNKPIRPLSPLVEPKRFTSVDKVEKNFTKHCNDIIGRDCTAQEKGNFIAYLLTVK